MAALPAPLPPSGDPNDMAMARINSASFESSPDMNNAELPTLDDPQVPPNMSSENFEDEAYKALLDKKKPSGQAKAKATGKAKASPKAKASGKKVMKKPVCAQVPAPQDTLPEYQLGTVDPNDFKKSRNYFTSKYYNYARTWAMNEHNLGKEDAAVARAAHKKASMVWAKANGQWANFDVCSFWQGSYRWRCILQRELQTKKKNILACRLVVAWHAWICCCCTCCCPWICLAFSLVIAVEIWLCKGSLEAPMPSKMDRPAENSRASQLRKLNDFRRVLPFMTVAAFTGMLSEIKKGTEIPDLTQRKHVREATSAVLEETVYGPALESIELVGKEKPIKVLVVNYLSLLQLCYQQGGSYHELMQATQACKPSSPECHWKVALYADEITPGAALGIHQGRKCWCVYASILQFGAIQLQKEHSWLPICIIRTSVVDRLEAGLSQLVSALMKQIFANKRCNVQAGLRLKGPSPDDWLTIYMSFGMFLQDGGAMKQAYLSKGDGGSRPCMLCANLYSGRTFPSCKYKLFTNDFLSMDGLVYCSDDDVFASIDKLQRQEGILNQSEFKLLQQAYGYTYNKHSLLADMSCRPFVKPITNYCHDWMHCIFAGGLMQETMHLWLQAIAPSMDVYANLEKYMALWCQPKSKALRLEMLFTPKRKTSNHQASTFKCSASEGLAMLPILCFYIHKVILRAGHCIAECQVVLALQRIADLVQAIPIMKVEPDMLNKAVSGFYKAMKHAKWEQSSIPKHHWLAHFGQNLAKFKVMPSCWTHERKHRIAKKIAENIHNTLQYEKSLVSEFVADDLFDLQAPGLFSTTARLDKRKSLTKRLAKFLEQQIPFGVAYTSCTAHLSPAGTCSSEDVVLISHSPLEAGVVACHFEIDGQVYTLMTCMVLQQYCKQSHSALWEKIGQQMLLPTSEIKCSLVWSQRNVDTMSTLIPKGYRPEDVWKSSNAKPHVLSISCWLCMFDFALLTDPWSLNLAMWHVWTLPSCVAALLSIACLHGFVDSCIIVFLQIVWPCQICWQLKKKQYFFVHQHQPFKLYFFWLMEHFFNFFHVTMVCSHVFFSYFALL